MGGYRFRLDAKDGDDLGVREFSEPNWDVGDTVALRDRIYRVYRVYRVVHLADDGEATGDADARGGANVDVSSNNPRRIK